MTDRTLRIAMIVLGLIGLGVASYLVYTHYAHVQVACSLGSQCETVQHSAYAELAGVPVALIGLIGYVTILGLLLFAPQNDNTRAALLFVVITGFGFSMYLTYRELFTINAICEWCVSSATIMTLLAALSITRFLRGGDPAGAPATNGDAAAPGTAGGGPEPGLAS
jgi:uncharacterized membrane protein